MSINDHTRKLIICGAEGQGYSTPEGPLSASRSLGPSLPSRSEGPKPLQCGGGTPVKSEPVRHMLSPLAVASSHEHPPVRAQEIQAPAKRQKLPEESANDVEVRWVASVEAGLALDPCPAVLVAPKVAAPVRREYVGEEWVRGMVDGLGPVTSEDEAEWKAYLLTQYGARSGSSNPRTGWGSPAPYPASPPHTVNRDA